MPVTQNGDIPGSDRIGIEIAEHVGTTLHCIEAPLHHSNQPTIRINCVSMTAADRAALQHFARTAIHELRAVYMLWVIAIYLFMIAIFLDALVRFNRFDQGTLEEEDLPDVGNRSGNVIICFGFFVLVAIGFYGFLRTGEVAGLRQILEALRQMVPG